jgi:hypothetical protein
MTASNTKWKIEGDYFEGCNCDSICPCIFKADPDEGYCNVTAAWHIQKGIYDNKVNLDGLNVVALFHTPGNMLTGPKWDAALYIDEGANKEQNNSLVSIFSGQAGGFFAALSNLIGKVMGVKSTPIEFGIDGKRRWLDIRVVGSSNNRDGGCRSKSRISYSESSLLCCPGIQSRNCKIKQIFLQ